MPAGTAGSGAALTGAGSTDSRIRATDAATLGRTTLRSVRSRGGSGGRSKLPGASTTRALRIDVHGSGTIDATDERIDVRGSGMIDAAGSQSASAASARADDCSRSRSVASSSSARPIHARHL